MELESVTKNAFYEKRLERTRCGGAYAPLISELRRLKQTEACLSSRPARTIRKKREDGVETDKLEGLKGGLSGQCSRYSEGRAYIHSQVQPCPFWSLPAHELVEMAGQGGISQLA